MMKRVLITGASSGIGKATALLLSQKGLSVVGTSRNISALSRDLAEDSLIQFVEMDVTNNESVQVGVGNALHMLHGVDVLINNAGISHIGAFEEIPDQEIRNLMETNFFGALSVIREVIPHMRKQGGGLIINMSSLGGLMGIPFQACYSASKYALEGFSEALRMELQLQGIEVVLIEPGNINTEISQNRKYFNPRSSCYKQGYSSAKNRIEKSVELAEPPFVVADRIYSIIQKNNPFMRYPSGKGTCVTAVVLKLLPQRLKEALISHYYRLPRKSIGNRTYQTRKISHIIGV